MGLTREQWERVEGMFARAVALPAGERGLFLSKLGGEDPAVVAELSALVDAAEGTGPVDCPVRVVGLEADDPLPAGTLLGPWRIGARIGTGGMGEVYAAQRADGAYEAEAAAKVLKRGLDTSALVSRFLRERRVLAQLTHPNIARLIDGGSTGDGRPYLVMERVRGLPITEYCRRQRCSTAEVLRLMITVCEAVHEAHRKLVVHRDLKPSNVLVADDGTVALLDFGIAKMLADEEVDETRQAGLTALTPAYAAPEQLLGEPVTTATDVYALGVMLYELLAGQLPHRRDSAAAAVAALARADETPVTLPSVARRRRSGTDDSLAAALPPDLDFVVLKALRRDPDRRYRSAADLGDDLRRVLDLRPVSARPDSLAYRTRRFVRRHRGAGAAGAVAVSAILAGAAVAVWQAGRAQEEAAKARAIKDFVVGLFALNSIEGDNPAEARRTTVEELLVQASQRIRGEFAEQPELRAELLGLLGDLNQDLGRFEEALALQRERLQLAGQEGAPLRAASARIEVAQSAAGLERHDEVRAQLAEAQRLLDAAGGGQSLDQARLWLLQAQLAAATRPKTDPAAREHARRAVALLESRHADTPERVQALYVLGEIEYNAGEGKRARETVRAGIDLARRGHASRKWLVGQGHFKLGAVTDYDDVPGMIDSYRHSLRTLAEVYGERHARTAKAEVDLGMALHDTIGRSEGLALMRSGVQKLARALPEDSAVSLDSRMILGTALMFEGRLPEALPWLEAVARTWSAKEPETVGNATAQLRLGTLYMHLGRYAAADERLRDAIAIRSRVRGPAHPYTLQVLIRHAELVRARGQARDAAAALRELRAPIQAASAGSVLALETALAGALVDAGATREGEAVAAGAVARVQARADRDAWKDYEAPALFERARARRRLGRAADALADAREAVRLLAAISWESSPQLAAARVEAAEALIDLHRPEEADRELERAAAAHAAHTELADHFRRPLREAQARLRRARG